MFESRRVMRLAELLRLIGCAPGRDLSGSILIECAALALFTGVQRIILRVTAWKRLTAIIWCRVIWNYLKLQRRQTPMTFEGDSRSRQECRFKRFPPLNYKDLYLELRKVLYFKTDSGHQYEDCWYRTYLKSSRNERKNRRSKQCLTMRDDS